MDAGQEDEYVDNLIKKMDVNNDGKIGFEEFVKFIKETGSADIMKCGNWKILNNCYVQQGVAQHIKYGNCTDEGNNKMHCTDLCRINAALEKTLCEKAATIDLQHINNKWLE